jgi:hypothetical protein
VKKPIVYVGTSVIGGCCDPEFREWSRRLLRDIQIGVFRLFLSDLIAAEIEDAPKEVQTYFFAFEECAAEILSLTPEAAELAEDYLRHKILSARYRDDARHIAMATVAGVDILVSWNFRHIVQYKKIQMFNAVNIEMGYKAILIHSPREVSAHDR